MKKPTYPCNNCKKIHYSLDGLINCQCRFKKLVKWKVPKKHKTTEPIKFKIWLK